jgi:hypothetical protein
MSPQTTNEIASIVEETTSAGSQRSANRHEEASSNIQDHFRHVGCYYVYIVAFFADTLEININKGSR